MRSQSLPQKGIPRFEDVLKERVEKQQDWLRKFEDLPLIDEESKTYKELCDGLIPQEDFFVDQLNDITLKFQAHYMTKMNKQLKSEKDQLEKLKNEMTSQIKLLVEQNNLKHKEILQKNEEQENLQRTNKMQGALIEKLKADNADLKNSNDIMSEENFLFQDRSSTKSQGRSSQSKIEVQLKNKIEESIEKDQIIRAREQENKELSEELERLQKFHNQEIRQIDDKRRNTSPSITSDKSSVIGQLEKKIRDLQQEYEEELSIKTTEIQEMQKQIRQKDGQISQYHKRDLATENTLNFQIDQEQKYQDIVRQFHTLEAEWRSMESYIKGLNEYQEHIETKYGMLLEQFQQVIIEQQESQAQQQISSDQENMYLNMIRLKDEEVKMLKEQQSQQRPKSTTKSQEEVEKLRFLESQAQHIEQSYSQALNERDSYIQDLKDQISQYQQQIDQVQSQYQRYESDTIQKKDKEINELQKTRELNQKLILNLEKQLQKINTSASTASANTSVAKKELELTQKQLEQKEKENEELRRSRITDNKEIQNLRKEINEVKNRLSEYEQKEMQNEEDELEEFDMTEIEFYLKEMMEVKNRILASMVNAKSLLGEQLRSQNRVEFDIKIELQEHKKYIQMSKEIVRKELEHLIMLNSHSIDIQTLLQDKQNSFSPENKVHQKQLERAYIKLKSLFDGEFENQESLEDIIEQVVASYEIIQEENKLLLKEREFYNDHNLKKFAKEIEDLKIENMRYKELVKQMKAEEQQKFQDQERQMIEKSQQHSKDLMKLSTQNDSLMQRNHALNNELRQILQQVEAQAELSENLQRENQYLKKKHIISEEKTQNPRKSSLSPNRSLNNDNQPNNQNREQKKPNHKRSIESQEAANKIAAREDPRKNNLIPGNHSPFILKTEPSEPARHTQLLPSYHSTLSASKKNSYTSNQFSSQRSGYTIREEENEKLNSLIDEYRKENERCSVKIQELQEKLHSTSSKFFKDKEKEERKRNDNKGNHFNGIQGSVNSYSVSLQQNPQYTLAQDANSHRLNQGLFSSSAKSLHYIHTIPEKDNEHFSPPKQQPQQQQPGQVVKNYQQPQSIHSHQQMGSGSFIFNLQKDGKLNSSTTVQHANKIGSSGDAAAIMQGNFSQSSQKPINMKHVSRHNARQFK